jgi:hypothetical protein
MMETTTTQQRLERIMREALEDCADGLTAEQKAILEKHFFG